MGSYEVWDVYANTQQLAQIFKNVPGTALEDIQVVGDGGLGTGALSGNTQTLVTLDHGQGVKEVDVSEGGFLTVGFTFYRTRFEILSKGGPNMATGHCEKEHHLQCEGRLCC
ncbi:hypothetical protein H6P81_014887 [Aristolochia fimbriata]|uniref:Uncharacterized protein n=1 Tax=Aristolochia fimbriata TaxID=158543 RepID=A0AAV7E7S7_ARIFI|nr:hypothetical protein H6P81_014887 [Aristolochia fimbriata]